MLCIGVDFGTSNSSAAVYDGRSIRLLPLDHVAADPMRDAFARLHRTVWRRLVRPDRPVALPGAEHRWSCPLEMQRVGEVTMVFADIGTVVQDAFALIDVSEPGRLFQSLKHFLPVTSFRATNVFGLISIEELLSLLARALRRESGRPSSPPHAPFRRLPGALF